MRDVKPTGERLLRSERSKAMVWRAAPHVLAWVIEGHGSAEITRRIIAELDDLVPLEGDFVVFNDTERMPGYDPEFRTLLTNWSSSKRDRLKAIHILTRSRVVAMGVSVANMVLGGNVKMYADRKAFEAEFRAAGGSPEQFRRVA